MAQTFKLLFFLSLVVACLEAQTTTESESTPPNTTGPTMTNPTVSASPSVTAESTGSASPSVTAESTGSATPSVTAESAGSATPSVSVNPTGSASPSVSVNPTGSASPSVPGDLTGSATPTSSSVTDGESSTTIPEPDSCDPNPCKDGSTCEARAYPDYVCLCLPGETYNNDTESCQAAKVFPGNLALPEMEYTGSMGNLKSPEFLQAEENITSEFFKIFSDTDGYLGSTVLTLEPLSTARVWSREDAQNGVSATVDIIFSATAQVTTNDIIGAIESHVEAHPESILAEANFTNGDLCDSKPCDENTTICSSREGSFNCRCGESYIQTSLSNRICVACPNGQGVHDGKCVNCSFGRSGLNCSESWQLSLVIVASVLGALLLITLILLPIVASKSLKKKSPKKNKNAGSQEPYISHMPAKAPLVNGSFANSQAASANRSDSAFANAGMPRIPRATTSGWDRANLEMTPSNSRQNLVPGGRNTRLYEDADDMAPYSQSPPQSNLYAQARPQSNLYAQNQPQANPYASNQGHANPYYKQDDGRRFN